MPNSGMPDQQNPDQLNPDQQNPDQGGQGNGAQSGSLDTDALLNYALDFIPVGAFYVGENGPWDWTISNDAGVSVAAPVSGNVVFTLPDGSTSAPQALLVDSQTSAALHRVGCRYALTQAGLHTALLTVMMADGTIEVDSVSLLAS